MRFPVGRVGVLLLLICLVAVPAFAQGGATSSIAGVVKDSEGGVIPGADVIVVSNATGNKFQSVTNTSGAFNVPALSAGCIR